jgi:hypothetical protein
MRAFDILGDLRAEALGKRDFHAAHEVRLPIIPGLPASDHSLDEATTYAASSSRTGRSRRTIYAGRGEVVWEFETAADAVGFMLRFG